MKTEQCSEIIDNSTPLRQGDILLFPCKMEDEKYGIVVTGDCDIAQKKCRRIISYCTITTAKYYIATELLPDVCVLEECRKMKESVLNSVCKLLKAKNSTTFFSTLLHQEDDYLKELLKDDSVIEKISVLKNLYSKKEYTLEDYKKIFKINNSKDIGDEKLKKVKEKILSKLSSLPGDKYYISEIPNQNDNYGYIVHLRFINTISQDDIEKQNNLYRIGHLEAPYLYKLTQKLGAVFSDIGEPEEFEKNKSEINKMLIEEL